MRVIVDTNVLVSAFFFGGVPGRLLEAWHTKVLRLVFSAPIVAEYREVGAALEKGYGGSDFESFAALLVLNSEIIEAPELPEQVCADADDDKFLACALAAAVRTIVTGDAALLALNGWSGLEILKPRAFIDKYVGQQGSR